MSVFIVCDGTVSVSAYNRPSCTGDWIEIDSAEIIQSGLTPAEWAYIGDGITWMFVLVGISICLIKLINLMSQRDSSNE